MGGRAAGGSGRASIVTSPRIQGSYAARLEAEQGEFIGSDASPAPVATAPSWWPRPLANRHNPKDGDEYWYRWYFYLPSETPLPVDGTNQAMTILQWTTAASGSTPGWEQLGIFQFRDTKASADPGPGHIELLYTDSGSRADGTEHFWRKAATAVTRNAWHKLLIHKRWSSSADGFMEIWYDDVKQTLADGTTKMYMRTLTPGYSARMQHGIYREQRYRRQRRHLQRRLQDRDQPGGGRGLRRRPAGGVQPSHTASGRC